MAKKIVRRKTRAKKTYKKKVNKRKTYKRKSYKKKRVGRKRTSRIKSGAATATYVQDIGGTATCTTAGNNKFIGHSTGGFDVLKVMILGLLKKLMQKYGIVYASDQEFLIEASAQQPFFTIEMQYRNDRTQQNNSTYSYEVGVGGTVYGVADAIANEINAAIQTQIASNATQAEPWIWSCIRLWTATTTGKKLEGLLAELNLELTKVDVSFTSTLRCQNKTATESATGGSGFTDVNNVNPLSCRLYKGYPGKNYIDLKSKQHNDATNYVGWVPHTIYGHMVDDTAYHTLTNFLALPGRKDVVCASIKDFVLHPGQIVEDKVFYHAKMPFNEMFRKIWIGQIATLTAPGNNHAVQFGKLHVIGFDKFLFDRTAASITYVTVGFQITQKYVVSVGLGKLKTVPYVNRYDTALTY